MTPAYDEMYLRNARTLLATSLDYAVNTVLCENIRSISKSRLTKRLGIISQEDLLKVLKAKEYAFIEIDLTK